MQTDGRLTTASFWEDVYLRECAPPTRPSPSSPVERSLMEALTADAAVRPGQRVLEVGCAPGRWMVFYAERFGAAVEGIEYSAAAARLTRENLRACAVEGVVHHADFWDFAPEQPYDLVVSVGFIEHFADVAGTFDRHVALVAPGGRLVVAVPNFQGINRILQRWFDADWLALHNMAAMGHDTYVRRARELDVATVAARYVGGFDPDIISVRRRGRKVLAPFWHLRRRGLGDSVNASWLSSFLFTVFERPRDAR